MNNCFIIYHTLAFQDIIRCLEGRIKILEDREAKNQTALEAAQTEIKILEDKDTKNQTAIEAAHTEKQTAVDEVLFDWLIQY